MVSQLYHKYSLPENLFDARLDGEFKNIYDYLVSVPVGIPLNIANGGTNSSTALNNHRIMISLGGKIVETSALTAATLIEADSNGLPVSLALGAAYQIVGMNSGATANVYLTLAGTTNEIIVGTSGSTITLSTPQAIATGSSPTFVGLTLSGLNSVGIVHTNSSGVFSTSLVVNADISATAAIAYAKLTLTGSVVNADIASGAAIVYSKLALSNSIVNADVATGAAIAYGKLALSNSIVNADISTSAAIAYSKLNLSASIVNADISASAAIALTKLNRTPPTIQQFTSGTGTYTLPSNIVYLRIKMVGGGGGGSGSGTASASSNGGTGGTTTFGTTLLSATGGTGGTFEGAGGGGGTASLGSGPIGTAISGGQGTGYTFDGTVAGLVDLAGGAGASSPLGGVGGGASQQTAGYAAIANSGSGGGGGGSGTLAASASGSGGGSGGWIDCLITASIAGTYAYAIGAAGTAGGAGTNGFAGGAGGSGYIIVEEHYI